MIGCFRACAVRLYRVFDRLSISKSIKDPHHVSLRIGLPLHAFHCRPRIRELFQLVLHAAVTTSASDVIAATNQLLPVKDRVVTDVPDTDGRITDTA